MAGFRAMNLLFGLVLMTGFSWGLYGQESIQTKVHYDADVAEAKAASAQRKAGKAK